MTSNPDVTAIKDETTRYRRTRCGPAQQARIEGLHSGAAMTAPAPAIAAISRTSQ